MSILRNAYVAVSNLGVEGHGNSSKGKVFAKGYNIERKSIDSNCMGLPSTRVLCKVSALIP